MDMRNLRIGVRLGLGFGLVLALLVAVVFGGNVVRERGMRELNEGLHTASAKADLAATMKDALLNAGISIRNIGLQSEVVATQAEETKVKEQRKRYQQAREQLVAVGLTE